MIYSKGSIKHRLMLVLIISFVLMASAFISLGVPRGYSDDDLIVSHAQANAQYAAIVTDENGASSLVWHDNRTGSYQLYYNKIIPPDDFVEYDADVALTTSPGDAMYPSLSQDQEGTLHVVWQDNRFGHWDIYYQKFDSLGLPLIDPERVTNHSGNSIRPKLTIDNGNNVHLTWYDDRSGTYELFWDKRVEPDVTPLSLSLTPETPCEDNIVEVNTTLYNAGMNTAENVTVDFYVDDTFEDTHSCTLEAHEQHPITFSWTALFGGHELRVELDAHDDIAESNEDNNTIASYIQIYRISTFSNMSIWANATIQHSVELSEVAIEAENDPNSTGTHQSINTFVNYTASPFFETATIHIGYDEEELGLIAENSLRMYYWDIYDFRGARWVPIEPCGVSINQDYVWAEVSQFSIFTALGNVKGDLDGDGDVDLSDLAQLLAHYGNTGMTYYDGDIDGDGDVDLSDLAALLGNYGAGT